MPKQAFLSALLENKQGKILVAKGKKNQQKKVVYKEEIRFLYNLHFLCFPYKTNNLDNSSFMQNIFAASYTSYTFMIILSSIRMIFLLILQHIIFRKPIMYILRYYLHPLKAFLKLRCLFQGRLVRYAQAIWRVLKSLTSWRKEVNLTYVRR